MQLPKRKQIRLQGYDYSSCGAYFVTVCINSSNTSLWENAGADIIRQNGIPLLSKHGVIIDKAINNIPKHYKNVIIDKYCIMPNHIHLIVFLLPDESGRIISAPTLSTIIGQMKRYVSKQIDFPLWQRSFNDRIIRNEKGYQEAWEYIDANPIRWREDEYLNKCK